MACYDDDGEPLVNEQGEVLVPSEDDKEYDEMEAINRMAFAVTYRQVRGAMQATRKGHDQRTYQKSLASGQKRPPPKFVKRGQPPVKCQGTREP